MDVFSALSTRPALQLDDQQSSTHLMHNSDCRSLLFTMTRCLTVLVFNEKVVVPGECARVRVRSLGRTH